MKHYILRINIETNKIVSFLISDYGLSEEDIKKRIEETDKDNLRFKHELVTDERIRQILEFKEDRKWELRDRCQAVAREVESAIDSLHDILADLQDEIKNIESMK
jgi:hypothetical protein